MIQEIDICSINEIAINAGEKILEVYHSDSFGVETKEDNSPLTRADKLSHGFIFDALSKLWPDIPIISEEGKEVPEQIRQQWKYFWLVDPLDGTKEFINRNGEFTVNIALIHQNHPVLGVLYVPVKQILYYAKQGDGSFKQSGDEKSIPIQVADLNASIIGVGSRSHASPEEEAYAAKVQAQEILGVGSSLKFAMVAEGKAHYYYRHGPTWEWDTGAGHVISECAGAIVSGLSYNKSNLLNSSFLVRSSKRLPDIG